MIKVLAREIVQAIAEETFKDKDKDSSLKEFITGVVNGRDAILRVPLKGLIFKAESSTFFLATFLTTGMKRCPIYDGEWARRMRRKFGRFAQFWHTCGSIKKIYEDFNLEGGPRIVG